MYYIIETQEQLKKFKSYDFSRCIVDVVTNNDHWHLVLSHISLVYIRPFKSRAGFIIPINHSESTGLEYSDIEPLISQQIGQIYAIDAKRLRYFFKRKKAVFCLKTAYYLKEGQAFPENTYDTTAYRFFMSKYEDSEDINTIIPIAKHYEKLEAASVQLKKHVSVIDEPYYDLYSDVAVKVFSTIEKAGVSVDSKEFSSHFSLKVPAASYNKDRVHTQYNLYTATGRPSNSFNGVNFAALNKENNSRRSFIPKNDYFVEFDYSSYHLKILCKLINYEFQDEDIHTHIAKFYFEKDSISEKEYSEGKQLTFKLLYTESNIKEVDKIPFFNKVREFKHSLWEKYRIDKYIPSFRSGRPLKHIDSITQILPYILQNYETERNIEVLSKILHYLRGKKTKLVLYCYDSFLFDYAKEDGKEILCNIAEILEDEGYSTSFKYGKNYNDLKYK
jgi:hypothetical protein